MKENLPEARSDDEALAWRSDVAQLVTRAFVGIFVTSAAVIGFAMERVPNRGVLIIGTLVAAGALAIPAFTCRPRGAALAWLIVGPSLAMALMGYSRVGVLSGPGVSLMVALMLAGLLLGHRAMIGLTVLAAAVLSVIAWAIVSGHFPAPHPADIDMRRAGTWARSLLVSFVASSLFGGLMVVVVTRMERACCSPAKKRCAVSKPSELAPKPSCKPSRASSWRWWGGSRPASRTTSTTI